MSFIITFLIGSALIASVAINVILVWYVNKLMSQVKAGFAGVDQFQALLEEYAGSLSQMLEMEQYYGDDTMKDAVRNTKMMIEASKFYKDAMLEDMEETPEEDKIDDTNKK